MNQRAQKVGKEIQHAISEILMEEYNYKFPGLLATISDVRVTDDIREAVIFCSVFGADDKLKDDYFKMLIKDIKKIRMKLAHKIIIKYVPRIQFKLDNTLNNVENINKLLRDVK